jgi:hypothetical protein
MNALECHILFTILFATGLLLTILSYSSNMNTMFEFKSLKSNRFSFNNFKITIFLMVLTGISAYASIAALLIHLFGK